MCNYISMNKLSTEVAIKYSFVLPQPLMKTILM